MKAPARLTAAEIAAILAAVEAILAGPDDGDAMGVNLAMLESGATKLAAMRAAIEARRR